MDRFLVPCHYHLRRAWITRKRRLLLMRNRTWFLMLWTLFYLAQISLPVRKGEYLAVNIDDVLHQQGVRKLENTLIGWMMLKQGVKPISTSDLKTSIDKVWNIQGQWKLIPLWKGYFNIQTEDLRERDIIFLRRAWPSEFGIMRLQKWMPEFNPYKITSSMMNVLTAHLWASPRIFPWAHHGIHWFSFRVSCEHGWKYTKWDHVPLRQGSYRVWST